MSIDDWRIQIDAIDRRLVDLLNERAKCVIEVGKIKKKSGIQVFDPARERQIISNITLDSKGPFDEDGLRRIFKQVIDECRRIEHR